MATHALIIGAEADIITGVDAVKSALSSLLVEQHVNNGHILPENRDCWKTLHLNAYQLQREVAKLVEHLDKTIGKL